MVPADIDETRRPGEPARALAVRLAREKADTVWSALGDSRTHTCVIGSDQVADCGGRIVGKPGRADANIELLLALSGREVQFYTAVHVIMSDASAPRMHLDCTTVAFRSLQRDEVSEYVAADRAWHCAGGFRAESAGIGLFRRITSEDPTGLIGLPLIFVADALRGAGFATIPAARSAPG